MSTIKKPKYSFIIPVYNAEQYLTQCITSILNQTYPYFEIILVDDGSPDNCPVLCNEWAEKDLRIKVIHKKNGGASSARNIGLSIALGEYIIFVDSDDYWADSNGLNKINSLFTPKVDIVIFSSMTYYESEHRFKEDRYVYPSEMNTLEPRECLKYMISHDLFNVHPGKKAFRKAFLLENKLFFKEGIRAEDIDLYINISCQLPVCRFLNDRIYVYRQHEQSVTANVSGQHLAEHLSIIEEHLQYPYPDEEIQAYIFSYMAYSMSIVLAHVALLKPDNRKDLYARIKNCQFLYKYTVYPRTRKISALYKICGLKVTALILKYYLGRNF